MFSVLDFNEPLVFPPNVAPGPVQAEAEFVMLNDQIGQVDALDSSFLSLDGLSFCDPRALHLPPTDSVSNQPLTPTEQDSFANVNFHHHRPDNYTLVSFDFLGQLVGQVSQPVGQNCQTYEASCSPSTLLPTDHALPHASPLSPPVSPLMRDSSQMSVDMFVGFDADSCAHHTAGRSSSNPVRPVKTKQEGKRADKPVEKSTRAVGRPVELPPSPVFESRTRSISVSSESTISIKSEPDVPSPPSLVASKGAGVGKVQKKRQVRNGRSANSCSMKSVPEQYAAGKAVKKAVKRGRKAPTNDDQDASKIFVCDQCDRRFRRQEHLKRHHRSLHTQEKPYACDQCSKRFSRSDNLSQHERTHREERKMAASASSSDDEDQE